MTLAGDTDEDFKKKPRSCLVGRGGRRGPLGKRLEREVPNRDEFEEHEASGRAHDRTWCRAGDAHVGANSDEHAIPTGTMTTRTNLSVAQWLLS